MQAEIDEAAPQEFLQVAALDRIAWPAAPDTFIPDGEHIWRICIPSGCLPGGVSRKCW